MPAQKTPSQLTRILYISTLQRLTVLNHRPGPNRPCPSSNSQPKELACPANPEEPDNEVESLDSASSVRDQVAILAGRLQGASAIQAFDEAWYKASRSTFK